MISASAFFAHSQSIDTTFKFAVACKVQPFKASFSDTINVTYLSVMDQNDNLSTSCTFFYQLLDSKGAAHASGVFTCSGTDYQGWNGNNLYPFTYVGNKLKLSFTQ